MDSFQSSVNEYDSELSYSPYENINDKPGWKNNMPEEYVLSPKDLTTTQSYTHVASKQTKKVMVQSLYDEDHYALPDIDGCITKKSGVLKDICNGKEKTTKNKRKGKNSATQWRILIGIIVLLLLGGIGGVVTVIFLGIICLFI